MNKRISVSLAVIGIFVLALSGIGHAASKSVNVESGSTVLVYGPSETDFVGGKPSGASNPASALSPVNSSWPQAPNPPSIVGNPDLAGAEWITTTTAPVDTAITYSLFQDSFTPPCTASNLEGILYTAANNAETVYFNENFLGSTADSGTNPPLPILYTFSFVPVQGENTFDFDVARDVPTASVANPVGLIYNAVISFTLPYVVWRPPINTGRTILKNGTTLPIKFELETDAGVLHTAQSVYLSITGPSGEVAELRSRPGFEILPWKRPVPCNFPYKKL